MGKSIDFNLEYDYKEFIKFLNWIQYKMTVWGGNKVDNYRKMLYVFCISKIIQLKIVKSILEFGPWTEIIEKY